MHRQPPSTAAPRGIHVLRWLQALGTITGGQSRATGTSNTLGNAWPQPWIFSPTGSMRAPHLGKRALEGALQRGILLIGLLTRATDASGTIDA
jgi:hypothetical protein